MFPTTPTLPTVIITPSTPMYLLPSRYSSIQPFTSPSSSPSSSTRQYTRKQHLMSALELESASSSSSTSSEKRSHTPDHALLLPPPLNLHAPQPRRQSMGLLLSLLVIGLFGLILVGPMLPYKWWTSATSGAEVPALLVAEPAVLDSSTTELSTPTSTLLGAELEDATGLARRWKAYGPGQGEDPLYTQAFGPGQAQMERDEASQEEVRSFVARWLEWTLLD